MVKCDLCGKDLKDSQGLAGHMRLAHPEGDGEAEDSAKVKAVVVGKPQPLDQVIENLRLPLVPEQYDGDRNIYVAGFNEGVIYGARTILAGIRAAQELSTMGIAQATPLIKMAQEMRQAEGQAAEKAVADTMGRVMPYLDQKLGELEQAVQQRKPDIASTPNPLMGVMARTLETAMDRLLAGMGWGGTPQTPGQRELPGWTYKRREGKADG